MNKEDLNAALFMGAIGMTLGLCAIIISIFALLK